MFFERVFYLFAVVVIVVFSVVSYKSLTDGYDLNKHYFSLGDLPRYDEFGKAKQNLEDYGESKKMRRPVGTVPFGPELPKSEETPVNEASDEYLQEAMLEDRAPEGQESWPTLTVAVNHSPPRKIVVGDDIDGIDIKLLEAFAKRAQVKLNYTSCSLSECMKLLDDSSVDAMTGLAMTDEREQSLAYLRPQIPFSTSINFYVRQNDGFLVKSYSDLKGKKVGHVKGESYFPQFDKDQELAKVAFTSEGDLVNGLLFEQVDVIIGDGFRLDYFLHVDGLDKRVARSEYEVAENVKLYFLILSKKSPLFDKRESWEQILAQMVLEGTVQSIIEDFFARIAVAKYQP